MGTPLGPKYIPYTYMDPLGRKAKSPQGRWQDVPRTPLLVPKPQKYVK